MPDAKAPSPPSVAPPIDPMLAKVADVLPEGEGFLFEPKWDGFRAIVFRTGGETFIQSRDGRPLNRYFPELEAALAAGLPKGAIVDGEVVVVRGSALDFDALQQRLHPAVSRVTRLAKETPASFVAFDLLAAGGRSTMELPQHERRLRLERLLGSVAPPLHVTPMTRDRVLAAEWLQRFEGAGLDGVMAKRVDAQYQPGKRAMWKIKHVRSADCVVAGFRWYKDTDDAVGSLLLGLYDEAGVLQQVGVTSSFTLAMRRQLAEELAPLRVDALAGHPWSGWGPAATEEVQALPGDGAKSQRVPDEGGTSQRVPGVDDKPRRVPGAASRWSAGKDLSWQPLRPERVVEVKYDHLQGDRFRHATTFLRWRPDKPPAACRYDQLEVTTAFALAEVFGSGDRR